MSKYQITATDAVIRTSDGASIPNAPGNRDYDEYLAWLEAGNVPDPYVPPPAPPVSILSQDLMAQFTDDDAGKIRTAVNGSVPFWRLWSSLQAQSDPMIVTNARFQAGWAALVQVLGKTRMDAIAAGLGITMETN